MNHSNCHLATLQITFNLGGRFPKHPGTESIPFRNECQPSIWAGCRLYLGDRRASPASRRRRRPRRGLNSVRRRDEIDRGGAARLHTGVLEIFRAIRSSSELFLADRRSSQPGQLRSRFRSLLSSSPSSRLPSSERLYPAVSIFIFLIAPSHLPNPPAATTPVALLTGQDGGR